MEKKSSPVNLLIPASGAAKYLAERMRQAANQTGGKLILTDLSPEPATKPFADFFYQTPRLTDQAFEGKILEIAQKHSINTILPKRQQEFLWWSAFAKKHPQFTLLLSGVETLKIADDKKNTYEWLKKNNFPVAPFVLKKDGDFTSAQKTLGPLPWFAKPFDGSGTRGVATINTPEDFAKLDNEMLLQPILKGVEYTINFYVDKQKKCRVVIPHRRLEVRDGEVSVGTTVNDPILIELGKQMAAKFPDAYGPLCFQIFHDTTKGLMNLGNIVITDLNARFGGGYPLAEAAGGNFVNWLILEAQGKPLPADAGKWKPGTHMERTETEIKILNSHVENIPVKKMTPR